MEGACGVAGAGVMPRSRTSTQWNSIAVWQSVGEDRR